MYACFPERFLKDMKKNSRIHQKNTREIIMSKSLQDWPNFWFFYLQAIPQ